MVDRYYYIGGAGPFIYDDDDIIDSTEYGYRDGETRDGFMTDGAIKTSYEPVDEEDMLRLRDVGLSNIELFSATGTITYTKSAVLATGTGYDLFLPTLLNGDSRLYEVKNVGVGSITLKPNAGDAGATIENETSQPLEAGYCITVLCDGTNWWII